MLMLHQLNTVDTPPPPANAPFRVLVSRVQYSMIERDVKQAVRLLEMSLSGLMSAETALRRWKGQIPPKVRDNLTLAFPSRRWTIR